MRKTREKGYTKKPTKKEVKKKKILSARAGQKCPVCKTTGSVVKRDDGNRFPFGDGMASFAHLGPEAFFPLECEVCKARFKKARESFFSRLRKILV